VALHGDEAHNIVCSRYHPACPRRMTRTARLMAVTGQPGRFYWDLPIRSSGWLPGDFRIIAVS